MWLCSLRVGMAVPNRSLKRTVQMLYHWGAHLSLCVTVCLLLTIQVFCYRWYVWQWQVWRSEDKQLGVWVLSYHGIPGLNSSHGVWQAVTLSHLSCSTMLLDQVFGPLWEWPSLSYIWCQCIHNTYLQGTIAFGIIWYLLFTNLSGQTIQGL